MYITQHTGLIFGGMFCKGDQIGRRGEGTSHALDTQCKKQDTLNRRTMYQ